MEKLQKLYQQIYDLDLSSTAYLYKKMMVNKTFIYHYCYLALADFYWLREITLFASLFIQKYKNINYFYVQFILIYINSVMVLLFFAKITATLLPNGNIFIFMHLVFLDIIKQCILPENKNSNLFCNFFSESIGKIPADNCSYRLSQSINKP
jgi:hypothetical protein